MGFTAQIGTPNSYPGNVELGINDQVLSANRISSPEVRIGVPLPGSPWFMLRAQQLGTAFALPPTIVVVSPQMPEVRNGPIPGSPFFHLTPAQSVVSVQFVAPPMVSSPPAPQMFAGPPMPGSPFFNLQLATSGPTVFTRPANPDIIIVQKVIIHSGFSVNPGVLISGRRPDRPGS